MTFKKHNSFHKADINDLSEIWKIIIYAKKSRRLDGSNQWQDGYPNKKTIEKDISSGFGYIISSNNQITAYVALINEIEPAYETLEGKWQSPNNQPYLVVHRLAVSKNGKGKGLAIKAMKFAEEKALSLDLKSIKVDTNFDNYPMLWILEKLHYTYCGQVYFRGSARRAYEKILIN